MPRGDFDYDPEHGPDRGREHLEVLRETIARNRDLDWEEYDENYAFTVLGDGTIRVSAADDGGGEGSGNGDRKEDGIDYPIEQEVDHVVTLEGGQVADCNCHVAQQPVGRPSCRHMRAVEAHPRL
jgi:hypothetical protein